MNNINSISSDKCIRGSHYVDGDEKFFAYICRRARLDYENPKAALINLVILILKLWLVTPCELYLASLIKCLLKHFSQKEEKTQQRFIFNVIMIVNQTGTREAIFLWRQHFAECYINLMSVTTMLLYLSHYFWTEFKSLAIFDEKN